MESHQQNENREFSRSPVKLTSEVRLPTGIVLQGRTHDVSMKGIWFETEKSPPQGSAVHIVLVLEGGAGQFRVQADGVVARTEATGMAVEFEKVDAESVEHLKKLVLYNAEDTEQVEDEFHQHIGLKRRED